jgi:hypothetical protein
MTVKDIEFNENDSMKVFEEKMSLLWNYNDILEERNFKSKIIEEFNLTQSSFNGFGGITKEEKEFDSLLIPFAPYLGKKKTTKFSKQLHKNLQIKTKIEKYINWHNLGIQNEEEGLLHDSLELLVKDDMISPNDFERWNIEI